MIANTIRNNPQISNCFRVLLQIKEFNSSSSIIWIYCSTVKRVLQGYKNVSKELNLPRWHDPKANTLDAGFEWLNNKDNGTWLTIADNADDNEVLSLAQHSPVERLNPVALNHYLPRSPKGSIVVTTRDPRIGKRLTDRKHPIKGFEFDLNEAGQLLKSKLPNSEDNDIGACELLERLILLPLAITHAAAYSHWRE